MTVSNVLRGHISGASVDTRERVLRAVRELDYIPVRAARQSSHVRTRIIGVIFDEVDAATDYWGLMTFRGLRQAALAHGYDLLILLCPSPDWAAGREAAPYLDRRTDGFIFVAPYNQGDLFKSLVKHNIPVVSCFETQVPDGVVHVSGDNEQAARIATEFLISRGHKRIAHLSGYLGRSYFQERRAGFYNTMKAAGLEAPCQLDMSRSRIDLPGPDTIAKLREHGITAVLAGNDYYALALWEQAEKHGLKVPDDLSIMGMDGVTEAERMNLSTVHLDMPAVGGCAVDALVERLKGSEMDLCHRNVMRNSLVERDSVRDMGG